MGDVTRILGRIESGDPSATEQLLPLVYEELHFFAAAAEAMRRILVDNARRKKSAKHGGGRDRVVLGDHQGAPAESSIDLDEALTKLAARDPRKAELVKLRYFAGLSVRDAAEALGISESTAHADWAYAKSWLRLQLGE